MIMSRLSPAFACTQTPFPPVPNTFTPPAPCHHWHQQSRKTGSHPKTAAAEKKKETTNLSKNKPFEEPCADDDHETRRESCSEAATSRSVALLASASRFIVSMRIWREVYGEKGKTVTIGQETRQFLTENTKKVKGKDGWTSLCAPRSATKTASSKTSHRP